MQGKKSLENFGILHVLKRPNTSELNENKLGSRHLCSVYTSQFHRDEVAPTKGIKLPVISVIYQPVKTKFQPVFSGNRPLFRPLVYMYICVYVYMCICVYVCVYVYMCICWFGFVKVGRVKLLGLI